MIDHLRSTRLSGGSGDAALVLAAHGSADDPRCAAPVHRLARTLRCSGRFGDVFAVFWTQPPYFRDLHDLTDAAMVVVVPVMTAGGYYARRVLPREIGLVDPPRGRQIVVTEALGEHPAIADLIVAQAVEAARTAGIEPSHARLLIVGHGTRRDPHASGATTLAHAESIARRANFRDVHVAFLEQDPQVADAMVAIDGVDRASTEPIIVVPFFIADGTHAMTDIRRAFGADAGANMHRARQRLIVFGQAVGERPELSNLIMSAALGALGPTRYLEEARA